MLGSEMKDLNRICRCLRLCSTVSEPRVPLEKWFHPPQGRCGRSSKHPPVARELRYKDSR